MGGDMSWQLKASVSPAYGHVVVQIAEELGITVGTLIRRSIEHYAVCVVSRELGSELSEALAWLGERVGDNRRGGGRPRSGAGEEG